MSEDFVPRVNFECMQRFQGRRVVLLGEFKGSADGNYVVKTSDEAEVRVLPGNAQTGAWGESPFVEVIGRVIDARTVQEESHINLRGPVVDMRLYNEMVKLMNSKYSNRFSA